MILQNALKLKDGDDIVYLKSAHVHDYVSYDFKNGDYASVDGGNEYFRAGWLFKDGSNLRNNPNVERYHLETDSSIDEIREKITLGFSRQRWQTEIDVFPNKRFDFGAFTGYYR
jgi:hypothetical protein